MRFLTHKPDGERRERGQIIVLLALAMIGLLVAAGLAVDGGVLFMRKAHLDRSVDAAALAGVVRLSATNDLTAANTRGMQLLAANRIFTYTPVNCVSVDWATHDYCGEQRLGRVPGAIAYHVEVRWQAETYFMPLIGINTVPLRSTATAEYMPMVDIYASDTSESGLLKTANQSIFGPGICTSYGDPVTPTNSAWYSELQGVYTYRIRIPDDYVNDFDEVRLEIFDPDTRNAPDAGTYTVYDLDGNAYTRNYTNANSPHTTCRTSAGPGTQINPCLIDIWNNMPNNSPIKDTQKELNRFWFVRIDENRGAGGGTGDGTCAQPSAYTTRYNTRTLYRLYYLEQLADGTLREVDLAYYIGKNDDPAQPILGSSPYTAAQAVAEAQATDMYWVSPGAPASERMPAYTYRDVFGPTFSTNVFSAAEPETWVENCEAYRGANPAHTGALRCEGNGDFIVDLTTETPGIYVEPGSGARDIYLDIRGLSGASENGFELWVGPPLSADPALYAAPAYVNARQAYVLRNQSNSIDVHMSNGIGLFGIGYLPMNSNVTDSVTIPLAYMPPEFGGQRLTVSLFDSDSNAAPPISYFFDSIPPEDWTACYAPRGSDCADAGGQSSHLLGPDNIPNNNQWSSYTFIIPSELDPGNVIPFYGGRLNVFYNAGQFDTFVWRMVIEARPFLTE